MRKQEKPASPVESDAVLTAISDLRRDYGDTAVRAAIARIGAIMDEFKPKTVADFTVDSIGIAIPAEQAQILREKKFTIFEARRHDLLDQLKTQLQNVRPRTLEQVASALKDPKCTSEMGSVGGEFEHSQISKQLANFERFADKSSKKIQSLVTDLLKEKQAEDKRDAATKASEERLAVYRKTVAQRNADKANKFKAKMERMAEKVQQSEEHQLEVKSEMEQSLQGKFARSAAVKAEQRKQMEQKAAERAERARKISQQVQEMAEARRDNSLLLAKKMEDSDEILRELREQQMRQSMQRQQERSRLQAEKMRHLEEMQDTRKTKREESFWKSFEHLEQVKSNGEQLLGQKSDKALKANQTRAEKARDRLSRSQERWCEHVDNLNSRRNKMVDQAKSAALARSITAPLIHREKFGVWKQAQETNVSRIRRAQNCSHTTALYRIAASQRSAENMRRTEEDLRAQRMKLVQDMAATKDNCSQAFVKIRHETNPKRVANLVKKLDPNVTIPDLEEPKGDKDGEEEKKPF
mmetsp:Transcript_59340/g.129991  ORF Transcript_59340/g.129991 Transcript_59340/m.129991 type:complete len:525 (+) Transcript_59340:37-1611(+)